MGKVSSVPMILIRSIESVDRPWVVRRLEGAFGDVAVARKGVLIDASVLPGFVATDGERPVGLLTYDAAHGECEVVAIVSIQEGRGIGRALMDAARDHAAASGSSRPTTIPGPFAFTSGGEWTSARSTATARAARGRSSLRCRNAGPTASRWSTSSNSSCGVPLRECTQPRRTSENTPTSGRFG